MAEDADLPPPLLDALMSQDPNLPSMAYQAYSQTPICVPWTNRPIALGVGFDSAAGAKAQSNDEGFRPSALSYAPEDMAYQLDPADNMNSFRQASSSHSSMSYEHMDFKGSLSVGNPLLGASGRGEFAKSVYGNRDVCPFLSNARSRLWHWGGMLTDRLEL